ncbi:NUDIX domain-containing protein [Rhizobiaceae bacterium BDR2-2]|uniref:NUDIX domain-containing protein n=1 Tax=Ectorhizobium quercum TaxID=2965071 RepID=A0AAE3MYZ8_9HYPH|nr:NUDIX domain-containing protein [Ectorhizobium quercum]MCX8996674.1 NUDIX domain-containing protein [Ectorhizobium quercum]
MQAGPVITIAAAAFLDRDGRTLLVRKRGSPFFMQPGGKIDAGETPREALVRELREELDLEVDAGDFAYAGLFSEEAANEPDTMVKAHVFVSFRPVEARALAEIEEARWFPLQGEPDAAFARLTENHILPLARRALAEGRYR